MAVKVLYSNNSVCHDNISFTETLHVTLFSNIEFIISIGRTETLECKVKVFVQAKLTFFLLVLVRAGKIRTL